MITSIIAREIQAFAVFFQLPGDVRITRIFRFIPVLPGERA
jgi:hypothetical protein